MRLGIFGLALVVPAVPAVLEAQQTGKAPTIGYLMERFPTTRRADQIIE
jgi:hypothetical protein